MEILKNVDVNEILKITASNPRNSSCQYFRIVLRRVKLKDEVYFQAEKFKGVQVFHENIAVVDLQPWLDTNVVGSYKQVCIVLPNKDITYLFSSNGKVKRIEKSTALKGENVNLQNNRSKKYILNEGDAIPAFVDLGIFTKDYKVVNSMFDKFKQINRFVEILDDVLKNYEKNDITVLDFGCGKSYLTFVIYHYLVNVRHLSAKIIGYDLKADVVAHCNALVRKYGYDNLTFVAADVSRDKLYDEQIDVVVSLHACDTATDYALHYAVNKGASYIFSVPCCQHQVNKSISKGGDLDVLLKYGIVKERVSALLTDTIRALLLEDEGYSVDVMEFVDLAHSPKNLMIRAKKLSKPKSNKNRSVIEDLMARYSFEQELYRLLQK